jgi:hypothetical protein
VIAKFIGLVSRAGFRRASVRWMEFISLGKLTIVGVLRVSKHPVFPSLVRFTSSLLIYQYLYVAKLHRKIDSI